ncbi:CLUMA_CG004877, isoform A [Clunio marinus]|uniref:CLUMA_CG004877, isoform A n=1 Tax=Clunio marinus TaxID=568069 RepID=A0A1J1HUG9_9DIPT|nr:CLUMA_CG004877, isoform A [Clunio marinus]
MPSQCKIRTDSLSHNVKALGKFDSYWGKLKLSNWDHEIMIYYIHDLLRKNFNPLIKTTQRVLLAQRQLVSATKFLRKRNC